jgi:large subunit ribosomal protein L10
MARWIREAQARQLAAEWNGTPAILLLDVRGLTASQAVVLRRALKAQGVRMRVVKNSVARHALEAIGRPLLKDRFEDMTAALWGEDPVAAVRVVQEYCAQAERPVRIRAGEWNGKVLEGAEIAALAALPGRREMLGMFTGALARMGAGRLACTLNALAGQFARVLAAIERSRKESSGSN